MSEHRSAAFGVDISTFKADLAYLCELVKKAPIEMRLRLLQKLKRLISVPGCLTLEAIKPGLGEFMRFGVRIDGELAKFERALLDAKFNRDWSKL